MVIAKSKKARPSLNNTIKSMDYTWKQDMDPPGTNSETALVPRAIFVPHGNTLPFEERHLTLEQPVMIGRNVYRATPSPSNAIFECRVLSRHHATLYYESGHFYLVDNQSSNGTFINNDKRCTTKAQEPHEVFSGDIVKFGISVVETVPKSGVNTFPPVIAMLKLFHPDGQEAKMTFNPTMSTALDFKELYQLNNYVQEAVSREAALEARLRALRECVERARGAAQASWELFVGEQRLLMRVRSLEAALAAGRAPDSAHLALLLDDKRNYQEVATESLRAAHEQRFALEEALERRGREAHALHHHNAALRRAAAAALADLQKLASRCERKMTAARNAIAAAEEKEAALRAKLPLVMYKECSGGEDAKLLVVSGDGDAAPPGGGGGGGGVVPRGPLEEALAALPDYIKLLLPPPLLQRVGLKAITLQGKPIKEVELILNSNNHQEYDAECKENCDSEKKESSENEEGSSPEIARAATDDEKQYRLNHEVITAESEEGGDKDEESEPASLVAPPAGNPDNNANSTFTDTNCEPQDELQNEKATALPELLLIMSGLNLEIKALRERLTIANSENRQLREIRDELLAAHTEQEDSAEVEDAASYRAKIADLQAQLSRASIVEESNIAEMKRLTASAATIHAELDLRPSREDLQQLNDLVADLTQQLQAKDDQLQQLLTRPPPQTVDKATETADDGTIEIETKADAPELDVGKVSAEIDDLFKLDYDEDEDTEADGDGDESTASVATEVTRDTEAEGDGAGDGVAEGVPEDVCEGAGEGARSDEDARLAGALANGALHALEEELVRAKESWALAAREKAALAAQLAALRQHPPRQPAAAALLALLVPAVAALAYWLLAPYLS